MGMPIGKGLANTQVKNASGVRKQCAGDMGRGDRKDPPAGAAQFPGKGLSNTQTKNSRTNRA